MVEGTKRVKLPRFFAAPFCQLLMITFCRKKQEKEKKEKEKAEKAEKAKAEAEKGEDKESTECLGRNRN